MKILKNQSGSMLVPEIILGVLVLVAVGFAAYSAFHAKKPAPSDSTHTVSSSMSPSASVSPASTASPKPANEFDVPELGFKMTLPNGLDGLVYTINPNHTGSANGSSYTFSTARMTTQYLQQNGCVADLGDITKYSADPRTLGITGLGTVEPVGSFWLEYEHPQSTCGNSATVNANQNTDINLLTQAFNTASPL